MGSLNASLLKEHRSAVQITILPDKHKSHNGGYSQMSSLQRSLRLQLKCIEQVSINLHSSALGDPFSITFICMLAWGNIKALYSKHFMCPIVHFLLNANQYKLNLDPTPQFPNRTSGELTLLKQDKSTHT